MRIVWLLVLLLASGCGPSGPSPVPSLAGSDNRACIDDIPLLVAETYKENSRDDPSAYGLLEEALANDADPLVPVAYVLIRWDLFVTRNGVDYAEERVVDALRRMREIAPNAYARLCTDALSSGLE